MGFSFHVFIYDGDFVLVCVTLPLAMSDRYRSEGLLSVKLLWNGQTVLQCRASGSRAEMLLRWHFTEFRAKT